MKKLSKDEMKKVIGGLGNPKVDTVYCQDGTSFPHPGADCRMGFQSLCDCHGGFSECVAYGHPVPPCNPPV